MIIYRNIQCNKEKFVKIQKYFFSSVISEVYRLHHVPLKPITLNTLIQRGPTPPLESLHWDDWIAENASKIIRSAHLLHYEMPVRLAGRIVDLENLPDSVSTMKSIKELRKLLLESFETMINFPLPKDLKEQEEFIKMHLLIRKRHASMHGAINEALQGYNVVSNNINEINKINVILDNFYSSRIGLRMIIDQHIQLQKLQPASYIGILSNECNPFKIINEVISHNQFNINDKYKINVEGNKNVLFKYIPYHLSIIVTEIIKYLIINCIKSDKNNNKISIFISGGENGISIRFSENGGQSIDFNEIPFIWSYLYNSKITNYIKKNLYDPVATEPKNRIYPDEMASDSFSMPITRLYARYFGGDLTIMPMEGYGTDIYLHLPRLHGEQEIK